MDTVSNTNSNNSELFKEKDSAASGLNFSNTLQPSTDKNILEYLYYYNGGGVAIGDINNDGLVDIYFTNNERSCSCNVAVTNKFLKEFCGNDVCTRLCVEVLRTPVATFE